MMTPTERIDETTEQEHRALELYAQTNGRGWRRQLIEDWASGRTTGELQMIRNSRGPSWLLQHYKPRKAAA